MTTQTIEGAQRYRASWAHEKCLEHRGNLADTRCYMQTGTCHGPISSNSSISRMHSEYRISQANIFTYWYVMHPSELMFSLRLALLFRKSSGMNIQVMHATRFIWIQFKCIEKISFSVSLRVSICIQEVNQDISHIQNTRSKSNPLICSDVWNDFVSNVKHSGGGGHDEAGRPPPVVQSLIPDRKFADTCRNHFVPQMKRYHQ